MKPRCLRPRGPGNSQGLLLVPAPKVGGVVNEGGMPPLLTCERRSKLTAPEKPWFPLTPQKKKRGRLFQRMVSGIRWHGKEKYSRFLTLTSSLTSPPVRVSWQKFKQRIQRLTVARLLKAGYLKPGQIHIFYPGKGIMEPIRFDYLRVQTDEGHGVLHIPYFGDYIPQKWLSDTWMALHGAWNVSVSARDQGNARKLAGYMLRQEVCGQDQYVGNISWSWSWVFRGFVGQWRALVRSYGFETGLLIWDAWMQHQRQPEICYEQTTFHGHS